MLNLERYPSGTFRSVERYLGYLAKYASKDALIGLYRLLLKNQASDEDPLYVWDVSKIYEYRECIFLKYMILNKRWDVVDNVSISGNLGLTIGVAINNHNLKLLDNLAEYDDKYVLEILKFCSENYIREIFLKYFKPIPELWFIIWRRDYLNLLYLNKVPLPKPTTRIQTYIINRIKKDYNV